MTEHWQVHMPDGSSQGVAMHVLSAHETLINRWGYSSGVEHLTADQEVPGSNPGAPSRLLTVYLLLSVHLRREMRGLPQPTLFYWRKLSNCGCS